MKKILKKDQKNFVTQVIDLLNKARVQEIKQLSFGKQYKLSTIFGYLGVTIREEHEYCYSVFMKFDKIEDMELFYKCFSKHEDINKFSFKWNIHNSDKEYVLDLLEERLSNLEYVKKVVKIADALKESFDTIFNWSESEINQTFNSLYNGR